jgi:hypothetical protein
MRHRLRLIGLPSAYSVSGRPVMGGAPFIGRSNTLVDSINYPVG